MGLFTLFKKKESSLTRDLALIIKLNEGENPSEKAFQTFNSLSGMNASVESLVSLFQGTPDYFPELEGDKISYLESLVRMHFNCEKQTNNALKYIEKIGKRMNVSESRIDNILVFALSPFDDILGCEFNYQGNEYEIETVLFEDIPLVCIEYPNGTIKHRPISFNELNYVRRNRNL